MASDPGFIDNYYTPPLFDLDLRIDRLNVERRCGICRWCAGLTDHPDDQLCARCEAER